jgi:4-amino-4-deoxy-L-arabinose transferase-like glycosyltransferase
MPKHHLIFLRRLPITLLILINMIIGFIFVKDYGESWDEPAVYAYGGRTIKVYSDFIHTGKIPDFTSAEEPLSTYGPAYYVAGEGLSKLFRALFPAWSYIDSWHFVIFITFQISILSLYFLAKKWMNNWAAFGTALLFSTQPLLWGHAFMNPKDIAFMAFFLASITLGLYMVDALAMPSNEFAGRKSENPSRKMKQQSNEKNSALIKPRLDAATSLGRIASFAGESLRLLLKPMVLGAGLLLGFTTSIRVLGPLAGGIVILYALGKYRLKAVVFLAPYLLVACLTTYLTWPYLWRNPIYHYLDSFFLMSHFPNGFSLLFQGKAYSVTDLPKIYLPFLMAVQFTEVILPLFITGLFFSAWRIWKDRNMEPLFLITFWLVFPLIAVICSGTLYFDNFRHLLFLIPPIFFACGLALEALFTKIHKGVLRGLILCALVLPGLYADIKLHPYQYVYYNSYVGGVRGAYHNFALDYWGVTFSEAAKYVNEIAPPNAKVVVVGPLDIFNDYARPDLQLFSLLNVKSNIHYDFVVIYSRGNEAQSVCPSVNAIKTIERDGAVLLTVKIPPISGKGCP